MKSYVNLINNYSVEELLPVVSELAFRYTGSAHSSVTYEKAQMLMEAVLYCIREFNLQQDNALKADAVPVREAYRQGQEIVMDHVRTLQALYNEMIPDFKDYGCLCLRDTVTKAVPAFLTRYDFRFAPQETPVLLDYPVQEPLGHLTGVNLVLPYLECICREQAYLRTIDEKEVIAILRDYHRDYVYLCENICQIVQKSRKAL